MPYPSRPAVPRSALLLLLLAIAAFAPAARAAVAGTAVSPPFRLDDHPGRPAIQGHDLTALPDGGWIAAWEALDLDTQLRRLVARRFHADGSPEGTEWLVAPEALNASPRIALRADGRTFCVVWRAGEGLRLRCLALDPADAAEEIAEVEVGSLPAAGRAGHDVGPQAVLWSRGDAIVRRELPEPGGPLPGPQVVDRAGRDHELTDPRFADGDADWRVWIDRDTVTEAGSYRTGGFESDPGPHLAGADIGALDDNLALAAWSEARPDGFGRRIYVQSHTPDLPPFSAREPVLVDDVESGLVAGPAIAFGDGLPGQPGYGVVLWSPLAGPFADRLPLQLVDWEGRPFGPVVPVLAEPPEDGWPVRPEIHRLADGRFLVTWMIDPDGRPRPFGVVEGFHAAFVEVEEGGGLLLQDGRFEVGVQWHDPYNGGSGVGRARPVTDDSGAFWFFREDNLELMVKVLDGRGVNGHWWVFWGGLSTVEFTLSVLDRDADRLRTYHNPPFELASHGDTAAFPDEEAAGAATGGGLDAGGPPWTGAASHPQSAAGPCTDPSLPVVRRPGLCLHDRFEVEVEWETPRHLEGHGQGGILTPASGYLWFFHPDNVELLVKVLDGRPVNGHWWVFSGALTNLGYTLIVRDTETLEERRFENAGGFNSFVDTTAFPLPGS